jgi:hypothetical protein
VGLLGAGFHLDNLSEYQPVAAGSAAGHLLVFGITAVGEVRAAGVVELLESRQLTCTRNDNGIISGILFFQSGVFGPDILQFPQQRPMGYGHEGESCLLLVMQGDSEVYQLSVHGKVDTAEADDNEIKGPEHCLIKTEHRRLHASLMACKMAGRITEQYGSVHGALLLMGIIQMNVLPSPASDSTQMDPL